MSSQEFIDTEMLHHSQLAFYEQAFRPVKRENLYFVEQAEKPVSYIGARCEFKLISYNNINRGLSRGVGAGFLVFWYP
ncbi:MULTISPECIES: hypothetical protein [unclassified Microcoleus]|uniref:hypothetical protein n=1 Tax=unclassified Microcoleus TaxID=2642155 RepID=UPI002FD65D9A